MYAKSTNRSTIINNYIDAHRDQIFSLGRRLFAHPELGFKEEKTQEIITSFLRDSQIPYEDHLSLTGVKATIGAQDGYHIALAADMDALEAARDDEKICIHACGHSIQVAAMLWTLKLLKDTRLLDGLAGRVSFLGTPAEEFLDFAFREQQRAEGKLRYLSGKQNMIADGLFDDVDCVLSAHINGEEGVRFDIGSTLAGFMVKRVVFKGQTAHSGASPHLGRNALHGATLFLQAVGFLKDQFPPKAGISIHPVIRSCGGSVNSIPDQVVVESYIRANDTGALFDTGGRFDRCALHCAEALGLSCEIGGQPGYLPLKQSAALNQVVYTQMLALVGEDQITKDVISGASGDMGDLGFLLPVVQFGFSGSEGRIHSSEFTIRDEEHVYCDTIRVVANTVAALLEDPALQVRNPDYQEKKAYYLKHWLHQPE